MASLSFDTTRHTLLAAANSLTDLHYSSTTNDAVAEQLLRELVDRLPTPPDYDHIDPALAQEISTSQRLLGQTSFRLFASNDRPVHLEQALTAYHEAVRTSGRYPDPALLLETVVVYRAHGSHEGALHLCCNLIQDHPTYHNIGQIVKHAIACMVQLNIKLPGQYIQWLCGMPNVLETDALLLTARASEMRGEREVARQGYREIFLRLLKERGDEERRMERDFVPPTEGGEGEGETKGDRRLPPTKQELFATVVATYRQTLLIGTHHKWDVWCEDPVTWIKAGRNWFDQKEYECSNAMYGAALQCSAMPGDECLTKLSVGCNQMGHHAKSL